MAIASDAEVRYGQSIQPAYETMKSIFVQVSGFMILRCAATPAALELAAKIDSSKQSLAEAQLHLLTTAPPEKYRHRHAHLVQAAAGLGVVLQTLMTKNPAEPMRDRQEQVLVKAYRAFQLGSARDLGLGTMDLSGSCCALGRKMA